MRLTHRAAVGLMLLVAVTSMSMIGCGTTTSRTGTEQLLISDAVDKAVDRIDFSALNGVKVYLDSRYISSLKTNLFIDSNYVISSLRQQLTSSGALIQDDREQATLIVEPRVGALGADGHDVTYGVPQSGALSSAVSVVSGSSIPSIPEISLGRTDAQSGVAKLVVFAYDRETREPIWQSGLAKAESTSSNTWILGAGPFQRGSIHKGVKFAGRKIDPPAHPTHQNMLNEEELYIPSELHFDQAFLFKQNPGREDEEEAEESDVAQASFEKEDDKADGEGKSSAKDGKQKPAAKKDSKVKQAGGGK
ncbi:DUF6655 family protein [Mariniblastus fucicola]|uniref:Uncharacterized protein n=1 Tax=Mariniblastus fucicola TaxID=980251 RepID=A0A5B9PGP1_9BACT|nr:DUF6655 family protein [Mariniblastus fucicola]QEG23766.1 hypothetical protein MFFC18_36680 [Mariniblastus fucicola]